GILAEGTYQVAGTLRFANANVATLAANLILDGAGPSRILDQNGNNGLVNLAVVDTGGSLTLLNGFSLTLSGNLANLGYLLIDPQSTLIVTGNFIQGADATLEIQLGGTPDTGLYGSMAVTGTADLDGTLTLTPVNGYTPSTGDSFSILTYGDRAGAFAVGPPGFDLNYDDIDGVLNVVAQ